MTWFRVHHGITSDNKWHIVAKKSGQNVGAVVSVWMALLEYASQSRDRGHVLGFDPEVIDALYGYDDGTAGSIVEALKLKGLICDDWIVNWDKRQPERDREDYSTERVRQFRDRKNQQKQQDTANNSFNSEATVTPCNAMKHHVTPPDTDTDTDTENIRNLGGRKGGAGGNPQGAIAPDASQAPLPTTQKSFSGESSLEKPATLPQTPYPKDFKASPETVAWIKQKIPDCDIAAELSAFREHHEARGSLMAKWDLAFRSWINRKLRFQSQDKISADKTTGNTVVKPEPERNPPPEVKSPVWDQALEKIREKVSAQAFDTWFVPVSFCGISDTGSLVVSVPTETYRTCITDNFTPLLLKSTGAKSLTIQLWKSTA